MSTHIAALFQLIPASFVLVTTMDDLALLQSDDISRDFNDMGLGIAFRICNRVKEINLEDEKCSIQIEEFTGNARQIVEAMRVFIRPSLNFLTNSKDREKSD